MRHKLRCRADDPPFARCNLEAGLDSGDLLEVDLRTAAAGEWVCLHDGTLDAETTGSGPVAAATRARLSALRMRRAGGQPGEPLLFLGELAARVARRTALPAGAVQLDLKVPAAEIGERAIARFRALVGPLAERFLLSSVDRAAVDRLASAVPGLRRGFDPLDLYGRRPPHERTELAGLFARTFELAPDADVYYVHWKLTLAAAASGHDFVAEAHARGARLTAWTVDPDLPGVETVLTRLLALGVDAITTNAPRALASILDRIAPEAGPPPPHPPETSGSPAARGMA